MVIRLSIMRRRGAAAGALGVVALAMGLLTAPVRGEAAEASSAMSEGARLPRTGAQAGAGVFAVGAAGGRRVALVRDNNTDQRTLIDLGGGPALAVPEQTAPGALRVSGVSLVQVEEDDDQDRYLIVDPATGRVQRRWRLPVSGSPSAVVGPDWAAFRLRRGSEDSLVLRRDGHADEVFPTAVNTAGAFMADPFTLVLDGIRGGVRVVDTRTWQTSVLDDQVRASVDFWVGPTRLFRLRRSTDGLFVQWRGRDETIWRETPVGVAESWEFVPFGDGLAQVHPDQRGRELRPIDLSTGERGAPVLSGIVPFRGVWPLGDGSVVAHVHRESGQALVTLAPGASPREVASLPGRWVDQMSVSVTGTRVRAHAASGDEVPSAVAYTDTRGSGAGTWTAAPQVDGQGLPGVLIATEGSTLLTRLGSEGAAATYRLTWPRGHRDLDAAREGIVLHPGGRLVSGLTEAGTPFTQDVFTSTVVARDDLRAGLVNDLEWWRRSSSARPHEFLVTDFGATPPTTRAVALDLPCPAAQLDQVVGRWALLLCVTGQSADAWIVDSHGDVADRWVASVTVGPSAYDRNVPLLGNGYFVQVRRASADDGVSAAHLAVVDLATGDERLVGPLTGAADGDDYGLDPGTGILAYLDEGRDVRWIPLTDPADPPVGAPDVTAPSVTLDGPPGDIVVGTRIALRWTATDPRGAAGQRISRVASVQVRQRRAPTPTGALGAWSTPPGGAAVLAPSLTVTAPGGSRTCVQLRAVDAAGNTGEWTSERCWVTDAAAPVAVGSTIGPRVVEALVASRVTYTYSASDDVAVASHDLQVRRAGAGQDLGGWSSPDGFLNRNTTTATVDVVPGGETCLRMRPRDRAGRVGSWSAPACASVPLDDRRLGAVRGRVERPTHGYGLGRTLTVLQSKGAQVSSFETYTGTGVALVVLRGPGQGAVDVSVGSVRLGRVSLAATTWSRDVVVLRSPQRFSGQRLTITLATDAQARLDAHAALRG